MKVRHYIAAVLGAVVLYPLSIGPVFKIGQMMNPHQYGSPAFFKFYWPLIWLGRQSQTADRIFGEYIDWWKPEFRGSK